MIAGFQALCMAATVETLAAPGRTAASESQCVPDLPVCASGWTGPRCDLACVSDQRCASAVYCHGWGTYGLSVFGTTLFGLDAEAPAWMVKAKLVEFISQHAESLGVAPGVSASDLGLVASADFRGDAGGLKILRFAQSYRQIPVFGPDATVRLVAGPGGVLGIRGAIVDGRVDYKWVDAPSSAAEAEASIRYHVMKKTGLPVDGFDVRDLRLVAMPRSRSLGWAASVDDGLHHIATVVVAADPGDAKDEIHPHPALLYFNEDVAEGLEDPVDIVALAEDPGSDVLSDPVSAVIQGALWDGTPLHGSQRDDGVALGDARVVAYDATGVPNFDTLTRLTPPEMNMVGLFVEPVGSSGFAVQSAYVAVQNMYAWTDRFMAGRWESLLGAASSLPPGTFQPRLMVLANVEDGADPCPSGAAAFVSVIHPPASGNGVPDEYKQPLGGAPFESVSYMALPGPGVVGPHVVGHEFGHFVDLFASPGMMDEGFRCEDCVPQCKAGTTDEASPLKESFSNWAALWYLRDLYQVGQSSTSCAVTVAVSLGADRSPHVQGCTKSSTDVVIFQPASACPAGFSCESLKPQDKSTTTGICSASRGYRMDSFHQALWESMHAQTCSLDPPFTCAARPELVTEPAGDMIGGALIFALRVDTATYRGFADDMATHVSCKHGEAAYKAFNEVLCHHGIRDCDAPTPVVCKTCGNGVVELDEGCDGTDFAGKGCADLGFSGGTLMCDANCVIDESNCSSDGSTTGTGGDSPMTGFDSDVPTTGALGTVSIGGGEASGAGSESSAGGEGGQDGCGCGTGGAPSAWLTLLLGGGAWLRRRRVKGGGALLLGALVVLASGCHTDRGMEEGSGGSEETGGSEGMSASSSSTGGEDEIDRRMFGRFYDDDVEVGYINADHDDPVAGRIYYFWRELEIRADGTLVTDHRVCDSGPGVTQFTWEHVGGGQLLVVPEMRYSDGSFRYYGSSVSSVMFAPGNGCDDLVEVIEYPDDDGRSPLTSRLVPGRVCAEPLSEDQCDFQFVWCDGVAPPVCMAAGDEG